MTLKSKICGVSDLKTLNYLINHNYPPQFIGFIVNYPKSKRHVDKKKLKDLMKIEKKKSLYVAVLVNPEKELLEEIKNFPFDYYQVYDCGVSQIESIKREYRKELEGQSFTDTLIFDKNRLTYQSQSSRQNSNGETYLVYDDYRKTGFCYNVEFKK